LKSPTCGFSAPNSIRTTSTFSIAQAVSSTNDGEMPPSIVSRPHSFYHGMKFIFSAILGIVIRRIYGVHRMRPAILTDDVHVSGGITLVQIPSPCISLLSLRWLLFLGLCWGTDLEDYEGYSCMRQWDRVAGQSIIHGTGKT